MIAGNQGSGYRNLSKARKVDFISFLGDTFKEDIDAYYIDTTTNEEVPYDFTGCVFMAHVKKRPTDNNPICNIGITTSDNTISLLIPAETMREFEAGTYYYDIEMYDANSENYTILYGTIKLIQDVTDFQEVIDEYYNSDFKDVYSILQGLKEGQEVIFSNNVQILTSLWILTTMQAIMLSRGTIETRHWLTMQLQSTFLNTIKILGIESIQYGAQFLNRISIVTYILQ